MLDIPFVMDSPQNPALNHIPLEIWLQIVSYLDQSDLAHLRLTVKTFVLIINSFSQSALRQLQALDPTIPEPSLQNNDLFLLLTQARHYINQQQMLEITHHHQQHAELAQKYLHDFIQPAKTNKELILRHQRLEDLNSELIKKYLDLFMGDVHLKLSYQGLTRLPGKLLTDPQYTNYWRHLNTLDISSNRIRFLPREIKHLTTLQKLDVSSNQLQFLPSEIQYLTALKELHCYHNKIAFLPKEIGYCIALQKLYCFHNCLQSLPAELKYCLALRKLHCYHNQLQDLPPEIFKLPLLSLECGTNPFLTDLIRRFEQTQLNPSLKTPSSCLAPISPILFSHSQASLNKMNNQVYENNQTPAIKQSRKKKLAAA